MALAEEMSSFSASASALWSILINSGVKDRSGGPHLNTQFEWEKEEHGEFLQI